MAEHLIEGNCFAYETITVSTTAIGPTAATRAPAAGAAKGCIVNPSDQDIRLRCDGGTPTASVGLRIAAGQSILIKGEGNVANLLMIREDGTNSSVGVHYLR